MIKNREQVELFFEAFQRKDYKTMQHCYAHYAHFYDPAFEHLNGFEVGKMWEMLLKNSGDLEVEFKIIGEKEHRVFATWEARYTFRLTGNKVLNKISSEFFLENGKIINHTDSFNFYKWAMQAFGMKGRLLGWTDFFKQKVRKTAQGNLQKYISSIN